MIYVKNTSNFSELINDITTKPKEGYLPLKILLTIRTTYSNEVITYSNTKLFKEIIPEPVDSEISIFSLLRNISSTLVRYVSEEVLRNSFVKPLKIISSEEGEYVSIVYSLIIKDEDKHSFNEFLLHNKGIFYKITSLQNLSCLDYYSKLIIPLLPIVKEK